MRPLSTRRAAAAANRIRGPQSALTDFLASHNISAQQIHLDYQQRLQDATNAEQQAGQAESENKENEEEDDGEDPVERQKRKRKEEKALMKIKQSKEFKRRKFEQKQELGSDYEPDDDELAQAMLAKSKPLPGQLDNCEICGKRFTVTPYSRTGPDGGLLCTKCSKELKDEEKKDQKANKKKIVAPRGRRRQTESDRLMGDVKPGAKSLVDICVRRVANVVHDIDEFGDMPQNLLDRLSQILSKQRVLTPRVLDLFLRQDVDRINVYDCGKLEKEDFQKIFAYMPNVEFVNLRFAGQLKDNVILYMVDKCKKIRHLQLGATNLVSDETWITLFRTLGPQLESLKLSELNDSLRDDTVKELVKHCQGLKRLKLRSCSHMTPESIDTLCGLTSLEHLTLAVAQDTSAESLVKLISSVGHNLRTLCLEDYSELDDTVLEAIKNTCSKLGKLRIRGSSLCSDAAFAGLFDNNSPFPPLVYADFADNRDIDNMNPEGPQDNPIGFGSLALAALIAHSGSRLERLDLKSCRHISHTALLDVFDGLKKYPEIKDIDLSFVTQVDEVVMIGIFKSCPKLTKLAVFACFNARRAVIPAGIAVVGLPNAQDSIVREGDAYMEM
ncbi:UV-damaged DNA-binding protein rad7 [Elasticomyces elasticus]|uniref:UV-damaged DNA-binding protein rad7 n=1 Tax=Exophiala sideris TaxID=1016849 RepID=A0ABR0J9N4_9EURO|nr:UV-damaged DNA-binding protein rad7 [Elasticomyces elasticus]KAK5026726.1 UV-damaged DNA-binding protein rad7 [Exophiala sideris]KAK5059451.1 UV-damaged DNA-binding protein rad7 [Exophiala sideris]KAK5177405.1 UV-damaged DNA-binding protein rad7 [Eurotiomycetes sp. CCFEE 6388]